ncbi:hypothetical protein BJ165DRAFT_1439647 [Panaeolus papilionaceus]|nr:hypothetical protein BJ165DRAFT_1439647 [Panaeolus papilionaceus]
MRVVLSSKVPTFHSLTVSECRILFLDPHSPGTATVSIKIAFSMWTSNLSGVPASSSTLYIMIWTQNAHRISLSTPSKNDGSYYLSRTCLMNKSYHLRTVRDFMHTALQYVPTRFSDDIVATLPPSQMSYICQNARTHIIVLSNPSAQCIYQHQGTQS